MAPITEQKKPVKLLGIGNSGAGKTGSLLGLLKRGYKLKMLDFDNGLDYLIAVVKRTDPKMLQQIDVISLGEEFKASPMGPVAKGSSRSAVKALNFLDKWDDGSNPCEWGLDTVFVLDSLTHFGQAAFAWAKTANPTLKDKRQLYNEAQQLVSTTLATLCGPGFNTNVLVLTHVELVEDSQGITKGFASSIGKALGPKIPSYFNTMLLYETVTRAGKTSRKIKTVPTSLIDLKNPVPWEIEAEYDIEDGLGLIFDIIKHANQGEQA